MPFLTDSGEKRKITWQRGDINKPLLGAADVTDKGNIMVFSKEGGCIIKDEKMEIYKMMLRSSKTKTTFARKGK